MKGHKISIDYGDYSSNCQDNLEEEGGEKRDSPTRLKNHKSKALDNNEGIENNTNKLSNNI